MHVRVRNGAFCLFVCLFRYDYRDILSEWCVIGASLKNPRNILHGVRECGRTGAKPHMEYVKIYASILDSSLWEEKPEVRIVFITLLAKMEPTTGFVKCATLERLAMLANVDIGAARVAVGILEGPDPVNPGQAHEGRRIKKVVGGWEVLNGPEYYQRGRREAWAAAARAYRERKAAEGQAKRKVKVRSAGSLAERQACKDMEQGEAA